MKSRAWFRSPRWSDQRKASRLYDHSDGAFGVPMELPLPIQHHMGRRLQRAAYCVTLPEQPRRATSTVVSSRRRELSMERRYRTFPSRGRSPAPPAAGSARLANYARSLARIATRRCRVRGARSSSRSWRHGRDDVDLVHDRRAPGRAGPEGDAIGSRELHGVLNCVRLGQREDVGGERMLTAVREIGNDR
jgi:hypothetical protein